MLVSSDITIEAVNRILSAIGDSPVNTIENPTNVNVINAINILDKTNRQEQARGWSWNEHEAYVLNPDTNTQRINWSSSFLRIKNTDGKVYVRKGEYLYNFSDQTYTFAKAITVKCVLLVPFEEMPEAMMNWIVAKASEEFQAKYLNDPDLGQKLQEEKAEAWRDLQDYELEANDNCNILQNPEIVSIVERN